MRFLIMSVAVTAFVSSAAASADTKDAKKAIDPTLKVVCKTEDVVGSKIPTRICKTKAQWEAERFDTQHALDNRAMWREAKPKAAGSGN